MTQITTTNQPLNTKDFFNRPDVKSKFEEILGKRAPQFMTSVLQIANSNELLKNADPLTIYNSALMSASLDLPLNNNLGFAYIVPYNQKQKDNSYRQVAQFQLGYKGFIQLAQRSGQFKTISACAIYDGQIKTNDQLKGIEFDFSVKSDKIVGYASYFKLLNGFEKTLYMTIEDVNKHAKKYSQTFKKGFGIWHDDFDAMAQKTVIKLLLSKFAPLSIEMQKAVLIDQAVIRDENGSDLEYSDYETVQVNKEDERINLLIKEAKSPKELAESLEGVTLNDNQLNLFNEKLNTFSNDK